MESCIGWIGGKRLLRKAILERFPTDEVGRYIEVFGGAGWVLFAKEKKSGQLEVYNDINGGLVNLFRCVKYHCGEVQKELDWLLTSREQFFDCLAQLDTRGLTDIQRRRGSSIRLKSASVVTSAPTPPVQKRLTPHQRIWKRLRSACGESTSNTRTLLT